MFEIPYIKLEIEGMKYSIVHALNTHHADIEKHVEEVLQQVIEKFDYTAVVEEIAKNAIEKAVKSSVETFFLYGEGRKVIDAMVLKMIKQQREDIFK